MSDVKILFKRLLHGEGLELPSYETDAAAGMDVRAALQEPLAIEPGERVLIPTGLQMAIPRGYEAQIRPRSGLAWRNGITLLNTPGTIDADYRGELKILTVNHGNESFTVNHGDRIAQMVIAPVTRSVAEEVDELPDTLRGSGGFGSTGVSG